MAEPTRGLHRSFRWLWWWLRQVSGDAGYENYLRRASAGKVRGGKDAPPMSPEEFYLDALRRRYSGVSRCC